MILKEDQPDIQKLLKTLEEDKIYHRFLEKLRAHGEAFFLNPRTAGLDVGCENKIHDLPNRGRIKLFYTEQHRLMVFFYKTSNIPWSLDRYAYGGIEYDLKDHLPDDEAMDEWITFLVSGFSPKRRPQDMIRSFSVDIPE